MTTHRGCLTVDKPKQKHIVIESDTDLVSFFQVNACHTDKLSGLTSVKNAIRPPFAVSERVQLNVGKLMFYKCNNSYLLTVQPKHLQQYYTAMYSQCIIVLRGNIASIQNVTVEHNFFSKLKGIWSRNASKAFKRSKYAKFQNLYN